MAVIGALVLHTHSLFIFLFSEVLRLKDLTKVSGTLVAFDTGEDGCELVDLEEE